MFKIMILTGIAAMALVGIGFLGVAIANEDILPERIGGNSGTGCDNSGGSYCGVQKKTEYCSGSGECTYADPADCPNYDDGTCDRYSGCGGC
jgi:hypothetical protein